MMQRVDHVRDGLPRWMQHRGKGKRKGKMRGWHKKQLQKLWFRQALLTECTEAKDICPSTKCPKKLIKCLKHKLQKISTRCRDFVHNLEQFKAGRKKAKKECRHKVRQCRKTFARPMPERHRCIRQARKAKHAAMRALRGSLKSQAWTVEKEEGEAAKTEQHAFDAKMTKLQTLVMTYKPPSNKPAEQPSMAEAAPAWTTGDMEAPAGEKDMGGWKMRVYTAEQQGRLGVDAEGTSLHEGKPSGAGVAHRLARALKCIPPSAWLLGCLLGLAGAGLVLALLFMRRRAANQNVVELQTVFDQLKEKQEPLGTETSETQV